jgi:ABC-type glycerol-3-phosphate transport system permease component
MREGILARVGAWAVITVAVAAVIFQLVWVLRVATKTEDEFISDPAALGGVVTFDNFETAWSSVNLAGAIFDTITITVAGAALATMLGTLAGFALARLPVPGRGLVLIMAVGGLTIPIAALVIPQFDQALDFGYLDSRIGLAVVYGSFFASWSTLFFFAYFRDLPPDLLEAAWLDGASTFQAFRHVALPLAAPAVAVGFVLNVFLQWSEILLGLIMLPSGDVQTAMTAVASFSTQFRVGGPLTAAATIIVVIPIFVLFVFAQRWLKTEIFGGSVKG